MSKNIHATSPDTRALTPWAWALILGIYLLVLMFLALWQACQAWPNRTIDNRVPDERENKQFLLDITTEKLVALHQAQDAIARWQLEGPTVVFTQAEKANIQDGLALAAEMDANVTNVPVVAKSVVVTQTQKTANSYSITNITGVNSMTTAMNLTQELSKAVVTVTNWPTNIVAVGKSPVLSFSGDLRLVSARNLSDASASLGNAIARMEGRLAYLETKKCLDPAGMRNNGVLPLTPVENTQLQNRIRTWAGSQGQSRFGSSDFDLLVLAFALGVFGGSIKCLASLVEYLGQEKFKVSWKSFYLLHPIIGGALATAFVLVLRGGLSKEPAVDTSTPYGLCAIAVIVGMFSDEATKKLAKIAQAVFTDNTSVDSIGDNTPSVQHITIEGTPAFDYDSISDLAAFAKLMGTPAVAGAAPVIITTITDLNSLSQYLARQLSAPTQALLKNYIATPTPQLPLQLQEALVADLNNIITTQALYVAPLFGDVVKSPEAIGLRQKLMSSDPPLQTGPDALSLNRLLLVASYPNQIVSWLVTLVGSDFLPTTVILIDGKPLPVGVKQTYINASTLVLALKISDFEPGDHTLIVSNKYPIGALVGAVKLSLP